MTAVHQDAALCGSPRHVLSGSVQCVAGTGIALLGTYLYTEVTKRYKTAPKPSTPPSATA